jgi:hypothetical protein
MARTFPMAFSFCRATFVRRVVPLLVHLGVTSSLFRPLHLCPAGRVIFLAAVTSFRGAQFLWVKFSLKMFLLRHATVARRDTFQQAEANFSWCLSFTLFVSFGSWRRHSAASFPSLRLFFFGSSTGIAVAFSAGTSAFCAASGFLSGEVGFFSSRRSSVVSRQAIVSSSILGLNADTISMWLDPMSLRMASVLALIPSILLDCLIQL